MQYRFITLIIIASIVLTAVLQAGSFSKKLTLETYMFLQQYEQVNNIKADKKTALENYSFQEQNGMDVVKIYIKINDKYSQSEIEKLGCDVLVKTKSVVLVSVPVSNVEKLTELEGVDLLEIGKKYKPTLDRALIPTGIKQVHSGNLLKQNYRGRDVIVGVVDWGFDFTHPMFLNNQNYSRVKRAWITDDNSGNPPNNSNVGTLYTDPDIIQNNLKYSSTKSIHGTHVLGIAAGSLINGQRYQYTGVAPAADIAVVELGSQKIDVNEAVQYLFSYSDYTGKPIVINMSLGSFSPADATSLRDIQLSEMLANQQGKIVVVSAGNEGNKGMHFKHKFTGSAQEVTGYTNVKMEQVQGTKSAYLVFTADQNETFAINFFITSPYSNAYYYINTAVTENKSLDTTVTITWPTSNGNLSKKYRIVYSAYTNSKDSYLSDKPYINMLVFDLEPNIYPEGINDYLSFKATSTNANLHGWNLFFDSLYNLPNRNDINVDSYYTLGTPAVVQEVITTAAYVTRDMIQPWYSTIVPPYSYGAGPENGIANFSSKGPLTNGTIKPDITAPGSSIYSAYNGYDNVSSQEYLASIVVDMTPDQKHGIVALSGTSMASPIVTGIVALMLEINPKLTQSEIKDIMRVTAINDAYTGNVKNNKSPVWGWGKIDAHAIMKNVELKNIDEKQNFEFTVFPNPIVNNELTVSVENETGNPFLVNIYDQTGELVYISSLQTTKTFDISKLQSGSYFLQIDNGKINSIKKITVTK